MGAYPQVADWNNDSLPDLLVGDSSGRITLFLNRGTFTNPSLTNSGFIRANNNYLDVGLRAAPVVTDWNDDGRKDLIVGEENGSVRLYLNSGTDEQPFFDDWTVIYAGDYPIQHFRSSPDVGDIDGDGLNDLVIAENNGYVYIYKNIGTENNPLFGQGERASVEGSAYVWVYYGARMDLNDWDNDGDLDLLIGDRNAYITLFLNQLISTGVDPSGSSAIPVELALYPNHPNPFNSTTQIRYALPEAGSVRLAIHDIRGRTIRTLVDSRQGPGVKTVCWNGRSERGHTVSSGLYLVVLTTGNRQITRKITLLR
jgi:hypothetical protein